MSQPRGAGPPRVVIADDQTLVRGGFRMILNSAGIPVVARPPTAKRRWPPCSGTGQMSC